jgi:hypothetical protein
MHGILSLAILNKQFNEYVDDGCCNESAECQARDNNNYQPTNKMVA